MYDISYIGSIFDSGCCMLVNPVNCIGVDGAGLALEFKQRFPDNSRFYKRSCHAGLVRLGSPLLYDRSPDANPSYIVNFPTKHHWKEQSVLTEVWAGLTVLDTMINRYQPGSVAIPALGCGLGGLEFDRVEHMIRTCLEAVSDPQVDIIVFAPERML